MQLQIGDVEVHYVEHGRGRTVLALHGAGVDHREIETWLEPMFTGRAGYRRIYPDLPGMGRTPAVPALISNDDVVAVLLGLIDELAPDEPFLMVGQSYGGYLARAVAAARPDRSAGLALVCPVGDSAGELPPHEAVHSEAAAFDVLPAEAVAGFSEYFVVQTSATARRYLDAVVPGTTLVDEAGLERIFARWAFARRPEDVGPYPQPALIVAGRQDSTAGFTAAGGLLPDYPRATYAVIDNAGHALPHEQPGLLAALVDDWLARTARHQLGPAGDDRPVDQG